MSLGEVKSRIAEQLLKAQDGVSKKQQVEISTHNNADCFSEFSGVWNDLVQLSNSPLCVTKEWISLWWDCFGENRNRLLNIVAIKFEGEIIAIAPFYIGFSNIGKRYSYTRLQLIGSGGSKNEQWGYPNDYGISDFLDIIVHPEYNDLVSDVITELLGKYIEFIDEMKFLEVRDDSFIKQALWPKIKKTNWDHHITAIDRCPFIDLQGIESIRDYVKKNNSSSARRRFRQTLKAINDDKEFCIREVTGRNEVQLAKDRLIKLHQDRWNEIGYTGVFHDKRFRKFFDELLDDCIKNNWLYFKETMDTEGVSSSRMLIRFNGKYYDYLSGFDPESPSSKYRPGYGLLLDVIEEAISKKIRYVELLRGQERYKHDFSDLKINNWGVSIKGNKKESVLNISLRNSVKVVANLYSIIAKESTLLNVQFKTIGIIKAFPSYFSFRWNTLKEKLS